jgi:hypothetical protein
MAATDSNASILRGLRADPASWSQLVAFAPADRTNAGTDVNLNNRHRALLALHAYHQPITRGTEDQALVAYLLDEEIRYHQDADQYLSSISLASYLLARYRHPAFLFAIHAARECNYDTSKQVDSHFMYYAAGGMENAKSFLEQCGVGDVLELAAEGSGRRRWWNYVMEEQGGRDEDVALRHVKREIMDRIAHDQSSGISDEVVEAFVSTSWRCQTARWQESLMLEEN